MAKIADTNETKDPITKMKSRKEVHPKHKRRLADFMQKWSTQIGLALSVVLSLYLPDLYIIGNTRETFDDAFDALLAVIFIVFVVECSVLSYTNKQYLFGFFFWMDVAGTLSILIDIRRLDFFL